VRETERGIPITRASVLLIACAVFPAISAAVDLTWDGGAGTNDWFTANNWDPNSYPHSTYNLTVLSGAPQTSTYVMVSSGGSITVNSSSASASLYLISVGDVGAGTLHVQNGGAISDSWAYVGDAPGSAGAATVEGPGSSWSNSLFLIVGQDGTGTLDILNGGEVQNTHGRIGDQTGSDGTVTVDGSGSLWTTNQYLHLGSDGNGTLNIRNGGAVVNEDRTYIAYAAGSSGTAIVDGAGSTWTHTHDLVVGNYGSATLEIRNGGAVSNADAACLSFSPGGDGTVIVDGAGSTWTNGSSVYVGGRETTAFGSGQLDVTDAGTVTVADTLKIWGAGTVNLDGGTIRTGSLDLSEAGAFNFTDGTVTIDGGTFIPKGDDITIDGGAPGKLPTLRLINGASATVAGGLYVGDGNAGAMTISGPGTSLTDGKTVYVGDDGGVGSLSILNGATVAINTPPMGWRSLYVGCYEGAEGSLLVQGAGSTLTCSHSFSVAYYGGTGSLEIRQGGMVSGASATVGDFNGAQGTATVDGVGSLWTNTNELFVGVGNGSSGTLSILNGGGVTNGTTGYIGFGTGSQGSVTVDGASSYWTNGRWLTVGGYGAATLSIQNGATVSNTDAYIACGGASSTVTVTGAGSTWNNTGSLYIGGREDTAGGTATLEVTAGGAVTVADTLKVWWGGTVNLDGGTIQTGSFDNSAAGAFSFNGGTLTVDGGWFSPGPDMFVLDGTGSPTLNLTNGATASLPENLCVGDTNTGILSVSGGSSISNQLAILGRLDGSAGAVMVNGTGSTWTNSDTLFVGIRGTSSLTIADGGSVSSAGALIGAGPGSHGTATLDGAGSTWSSGSLTVGGGTGTGALTVTNGGALSTAEAWVDSGPGYQATVTVTGTDSSWTSTSYLNVGSMGTGTVNILDGGAVSNTLGVIGMSAGSEGTINVDGTGSNWTNTVDGLILGYWGQGSLNITNGGTVSNTLAFLGSSSGTGYVGTGTATVDGAGSTFTNSGDLYVGELGVGVLNVLSGGAVSNVDGFIGAYGGGDSEGSVTVDGAGSTWSSTGSLYVGGQEDTAGGTATLDVTGGGTVTVTDTLKIWGAGTVALDGGQVTAAGVDNEGTISGTGEVQAAALSNSGTVSPGLSAGVMTVDGDFTQAAAGTLKIDLAGSAAHDILDVTGAASLDGELTVLLIDGFNCTCGQEFTILTAGAGVTGEFSSVSGPVLDVACNPFNVVITTTAMGDASLDGCVDGGDYTLWADHYSQGGAWCDGDFNCDGFVDGGDYTLWADNYGYGTGGAGVPEPAALSTLILGGWLALLRRSRSAGR